MITLQTITGLLIAAMLNVLGTGQHEVTKVGNEPVVKETVAMQTQERWFLVDVSGDQTQPENQMIQTVLDLGDNPEAPCTASGGEICAVKLAVGTGVNPESFEGQTVDYALGNGALPPSSGIEYSHRTP